MQVSVLTTVAKSFTVGKRLSHCITFHSDNNPKNRDNNYHPQFRGEETKCLRGDVAWPNSQKMNKSNRKISFFITKNSPSEIFNAKMK